MTHICNDCKYNDICKEKFKEKSVLLCKNKYFQKEREKEFSSEGKI